MVDFGSGHNGVDDVPMKEIIPWRSAGPSNPPQVKINRERWAWANPIARE